MYCQHDYCPHLHFKKCMVKRKQTIPYTIFPDKSVTPFTNLPIRCAKLYESNVPTVAYENYTINHGSSDQDRNFSRDYYLNKEAGTSDMMNTIVQEQEEEMSKKSAYILAEGESEKYREFQKKKNLSIKHARSQAISKYNTHFKDIKKEQELSNEENQIWLKKLYRKLDQVARHIIQAKGENKSDKEKQFLLSKTNLTPNYLAQIKVRNPKVACEMLEQLKTLMMKKKLKYQEQREEQENNKSASMSFGSQTGNQSNNQNSVLSVQSLNSTNAFGEDQVVDKYCNFQALKKKWKLQDIEEVRNVIRRILTKQMVAEAQLDGVKKRKQAQKIEEKFKKITQNKKIDSTKQYKKDKVKKQIREKKHKNYGQTTFFDTTKITLTRDEQKTKDQLIDGGKFDAIGQIFKRNRNYSEMFRKKQNQSTVQFSFQEKSNSFVKGRSCSTRA